MLQMQKAIEAMTNDSFAVIANRPRYERDGIERLQHHLRQFRQHPYAVVNRDDLVVTSGDATQMTAAQWAVVQEVQSLSPEATIVVRVHKIEWKCAKSRWLCRRYSACS